MYNNPYIQSINQQNFNDRIDNEIERLKQMKTDRQQPIQPPSINQTFQLAPTNNHTMRFANTIDDVNKEVVYYDTPFFSKDLSVMWLKNAKGEIKSYELNEIVLKDEKDIMIENLQAQINELKGMINNDANVTNVSAEQITTDTTGNDTTIRKEFESTKSTGVSKISGSKKKQ